MTPKIRAKAMGVRYTKIFQCINIPQSEGWGDGGGNPNLW